MKIKNFKSRSTSGGYTLLELLIYIAIFAIAAGMFAGILVTFSRVQNQSVAGSEISQQLAFIQTTVQGLVREAVNIHNPAGVASSSLVLRMASSTLDPTIISSDANSIYIKQGTGPVTPLTNSRVKVAQFQIIKYENPGAHAVVQVDISLSYNSQNPFQQITRSLTTAIGRATAATFDDNLLPNQDNQFSVGLLPSNRWKNLSLSNLLYLGNLTVDPTGSNGAIYYNSTNNVFRGYKAGSWQNLGEGFWAASSTAIYNTNSGNVGIGTTNPGAPLEVNLGSGLRNIILSGTTLLKQITAGNLTSQVGISGGDEVGSSRGGYFRAYGISSASVPGDIEISSGNNPGSKLKLGNSDNWYLTVTGGNVGIGTASPGSNLTVSNNSASEVTDISITNTSGGGSKLIFGGSGGNGPSGVALGTDAANWSMYAVPTNNHNLVFANGYFPNGMLVLQHGVSGNVGIGTTGPGYTLTVNGTAWVTSGAWSGSDVRWKKNISSLSLQSSLDKVMQLNPVSFDWRATEFPNMHFSSSTQLGFIAQDMEKIIPEVVTMDNNGYKGISYERITTVLTAAIQEQQKQIEELKSQIKELKELKSCPAN